MERRILAAGVLAAAMAAGGGCCCGPPPCADGVCGSAAGPCGGDSCGAGAPCDDGGCDSCGGCGWGLWSGACSREHGCGEVYWGEWISDPPAACDPCDHCGNWVGPRRCGGCCFWEGLRKLWGFRYTPSCEPGCAECGGAGGCGCGADPGGAVNGEVIETMASDAPTPSSTTASAHTVSKAPSPHPARRAVR